MTPTFLEATFKAGLFHLNYMEEKKDLRVARPPQPETILRLGTYSFCRNAEFVRNVSVWEIFAHGCLEDNTDTDYTRAWNSKQFLDYQYFCLMHWEIRRPVEPS